MPSSIRFPADLPIPLRDSYSESFEEIHRRLQMEAGTERRRARMRKAPRVFKLNLILDQVEYQVFDSWWQNTILGGELDFDIQLLNDDDANDLIWFTVSILGGEYSLNVTQSFDYEISFTVRAINDGFADRPSATNELRGSSSIGMKASTGQLLVYTPFSGAARLGLKSTKSIMNLPPLRGAVSFYLSAKARLTPPPPPPPLPANRVIAVGNISPYSYYSDDNGVTWTAAGTGLPTCTYNSAYALAYGASLMVTSPGSIMYYSTDGVNWSAGTGCTVSYGAVYFNGSYFLAIADGTNKVAKSTDGIAWTESTRTGWTTATSLNPIVWNPVRSEWLCAEYASSSPGTMNIWSSTDGIAWTGVTTISSQSFSALMCSPGGLYALLDYSISTDVLTSTDGATWTAQSIVTNNVFLHGIHADGRFVGMSLSGTAVVSSDGVTWTRRFLPAGSWNSVTWNGTNYVACSVGGTNKMATSPTGTTWTARTVTDIDFRAIRAATVY